MKYCIAILLTLYCYVAHTEITKVKDMKEVFTYINEADQETLVIFDLDMVLVQPSDPAFQMANMNRFSKICKRIMQEIPKEKQMIFLTLMNTSSEPILIDKNIPHLLNQMKSNIPVIALTNNLTGDFDGIRKVERWRIKKLRSLGIDFSKKAPCKTSLVFNNLPSYRGNYSLYVDGMFFVNGTTISKGEALLSFLEKTHFSPSRIIFIDDREENLTNVETALRSKKEPVKYLGLHFLGAKYYPSKIISEEEFEASWQALASKARQLK